MVYTDNTAYGIEKIPERFLKDGAELLTESVYNYQPFLKSKFPLVCKTVKPLSKNHRSVS